LEPTTIHHHLIRVNKMVAKNEKPKAKSWQNRVLR
jgi:hypothetical protein